MPTTDDIKLLFAEFPRDAISWRAQSLTSDGDKALALAYIDARDVMDRLDEVCGAENWQDRYEFHGVRTICYLSIRVDGEWVTKADGAGDSDVEAEKGAISDALKRAAVKWGIGRYLYAIPAPWVPCQSSDYKGKKQWKKWTDDPWKHVRGAPPQKAADKTTTPAKPTAADQKSLSDLISSMRENKTTTELKSWWIDADCKAARARLPDGLYETLKADFATYGASLVEDRFPGDMPMTDAEASRHPMNA